MSLSLPSDFVVRMQALFGDEYKDFEKSFTTAESSVGIRINTLKSSAADKLSALPDSFDPVPWCKDGRYGDKSLLNGKHPYHAAGLFYFQEPSAMAAVPLACIKPGERVLDLCAAPGGKSTQAAAMLAGKGLLVANELVPSRAKILSENIERMGVKNAVVTNEAPEKLAKKYPEYFDCIILDAPCSGEGMFRKEPQALTEWSSEHSDACAVRQKHIAESAVKMLAPGGRLVYSTCTFSYCENEGVAEYITSANPDIHLIPSVASGLSKGFDKQGLTARILPHKARGEGHFAALFEKDGEKPQRQPITPSNAPKEFCEFADKYLKKLPVGIYITFGDRLYLMPEKLDIKNIKVLRAGLELGEIRKGRFIPSHALALALNAEDFVNTVNFEATAPEIKAFMHGETLTASINGWCAVLVDGYPLGWAKGSDGILKNHYPKHIRI